MERLAKVAVQNMQSDKYMLFFCANCPRRLKFLKFDGHLRCFPMYDEDREPKRQLCLRWQEVKKIIERAEEVDDMIANAANRGE